MGLLNSRILGSQDSSLVDPGPPEATPGPSFASRSRKRKLSSCDCLGPRVDIRESENQGVNLLQVLGIFCRKRVKIASRHAYQTLFLKGEDSDIKIRALGKIWRLHKVFLCQSGYFANILKGTWKESNNDIIELRIKDESIDRRSLHFVFGSLYLDEDLPLKPLQVPHVLAAACLLQVERVIQLCNETMKKTIGMKTVCSYYIAAETHGLKAVKTRCFEWLLHNFMTHARVQLYKELDVKLVYLLVSSSDLLVKGKEIDVYSRVKEWMFLCLHPSWKGSVDQLLDCTNSWLSQHMERLGSMTFLESEEGLVFQPVFKQLRLQHIIYDLLPTRILERDRLIPKEWLSSVYKQQWLALFHAQQDEEIGPQTINEEELERCSMRCGKRIRKDGKYSWKWSACKFSFPLLVTFTSYCIIFKQRHPRCDGSPCLNHRRNVVFRITLVHFDSDGKIAFRKTTGYKTLTLDDEEHVVMKLGDTALPFPLYIFCNFLFILPTAEDLAKY
ncbi:germ cell-less protein-like 2 [Acomys russatus]|uniref:germ cell-less protein-like 2 n=1 Tax=Acomys russatus TaxID=60746 RepID=UPI0021E2C1BD|nr:germ cell-less protein-like 2 [Acomys russatus]